MSDKKKKKPFSGVVSYFKDVRAELKKVAWPTLKQIQNNTVIVIIALLLVGAMIWVIDLGFGITLGTVIESADPGSQLQDNINIPEGMDLEGLDLEGMDLEGLDLEGGDIIENEDADLEGAEDIDGESTRDEPAESPEDESAQSE